VDALPSALLSGLGPLNGLSTFKAALARVRAGTGRGKIVEIHVVAARTVGRIHQAELAFEGQARRRGNGVIRSGYEDHHAVETFRPWPHLFEAKAVIQRQPRDELELIAHIVAAIDLLSGHKRI